MIESKNMNYNLSNKKTILIIGFPWPYTYGGHRTTKLCRELSKNYNVICLTRPLFRYLDKLNSEPFKIIQTKGIITIYDPIRFIFTLISKMKKTKGEILFLDSGLINKINKKKNLPLPIKILKNLSFKLKFYFDNFFALPDDHWPWIISSFRLTKQVYEKYKPTYIISSFPVSSHLIAARIKKNNPEVKWIADFPDLWSQNHFYPHIKIRQNIDKLIEKKSLRNCDKIITCQPGWAKILKQMHSSKIQYIPHCTDLELHKKKQKSVIKSKDFIIRYLGTLYEQQLDYLKIFMKSFESFIEYMEINKLNQNQVRVEFIGTTSSSLKNIINESKHKSYFRILPKVSYEESLNLIHSAKLLFLPLYLQDEKLVNTVSSKLIEYIVSKNQCLIIGDHCEDLKLLINDYPLLNSERKCLKILINSFINYKETFNNLSIGANIDLEKFSIKSMSERFLNFNIIS